MARTPVGKRHEIVLQYVVASGMTRIQATCVCGLFHPPPRFDRLRAEEDGRWHMDDYVVKGRPLKKGKTIDGSTDQDT